MSVPTDKPSQNHGHDEVPSDPVDGARFECSHCGIAFVYVDLGDGQPGEWVDVTPSGQP